MSDKEIWKDIPGYEGVYKASSYGRIKRVGAYKNQFRKSWESEKILKPGVKPNGYLFVNLSKDGKQKVHHVHRLIAETFIANTQNKPTVNHKDGDKSNNNIENLEWATYKENNIHSIQVLGNGRHRRNGGGKTVLQFDLDMNLIAEYPSYRQAVRETGILSIDVVCRGERQKGKKQKTAGGYIWRYKEDIF